MKVVPGALVDYYSEGEIVAGVVLCEEKGRLRVATESGREDRIAPARVLAAYEGNPRLAMLPGKPEPAKLEAAYKVAAEHARIARERREPLDLALVWEIVVDEGGERTLEELTELATGERSAAACAAMLRALLEEKAHFTRRTDLWESRSRASVEEILRQREIERRKAEERRRFLDKARLAMAGGTPFISSGEESEVRWLAALQDLAVQGSGAADPREALALLTELGVRSESPEEGAFRLLRALGIFAEDENLFIRRYGLQAEFPPEAEEIARTAIAEALGGATGLAGSAIPPTLASELAQGLRRDLTSLDMFSVDDEGTSEIDDALSVEPISAGRFRVGIHIADPGFFVTPGSALDRIVETRAVTFYLPDRRVLMLPPIVSEEAASLVPSGPRPAMSFLAILDEPGTLLEWEIVPSVIRSRARVSYEQADAVARGEASSGADGGASGLAPGVTDQILMLYRLALALEAGRIASGAHLIRAPEVDLSVEADGKITLKRMEGDDPGRILVSEMMILASRIAALFCLANSVPCIYRRQPPAEESFPSVLGGPYDPVAVRKARRGMRRSESGLVPGRHYALGLDAYAQATSPIRRYQDLVIHRQIKSVLRGGPPCYDAETLQRIAVLTDDAERIARLAERGSDEYWTLKYLATKKGQSVEGVIVYKDRRRVEVELGETLFNVSIAPRSDHEVGQRLTLMVESVNPRGPSIHLRQLD